jgi:molybdopterin-guanine dinucleotide biosynthesis protein A
MTSIILAGGNSSRFGWNKALEIINGKNLVQRVVNCLISLSNELIIVTAQYVKVVAPVVLPALLEQSL